MLRRSDTAVGAAAAAGGAALAAVETAQPLLWLSAAGLGAALGASRRRPTAGWLLGSAAALLAVPDPSLTIAAALLVTAVAFATGRWGGRVSAPLGALALLCSAELVTWLDQEPGVPIVLLVGTGWIAGQAIRQRDLVAARLAERVEELDREREAYAALSVRYERARIASELHDIVAHAISVVVVQAGAGQRLAAIDPGLTAETFEAIAGAAHQAEEDMGRLVDLLADDAPAAAAPDLTLLEELIARAAGTGLDVTLRLEGSQEGLPAAAVEAAYRVVRESLTNALRYASGAQVQVLVRGEPSAVVVEVVNDPPSGPVAAALAGHGTGNGLRGLRELVGGLGGRLDAGPWGHGGWRVAAHLPRRVPAAVPAPAAAR